MNNTKHLTTWIIWIILMIVLVTFLTDTLINGDDKTIFMPDELSSGHHQIGVSCSACHGESFSDKDAMQKKCIDCHGEQRQKPFDSHPRAKFTDPRNADRLDNINALYCVTCHVEHKPDLADKTGVTQPTDFCVYCHKDIEKDRPSHKSMDFTTCANAGCHNFHNNRALYTDYLLKHSEDPDLLAKRLVKEREFGSILDEVATYPHSTYPVKVLGLEDIDAPKAISKQKSKEQALDDIKHDWLTTAHAKIGANCSSCHTIQSENKKVAEWIDKPNHKACAQCHDVEVKHFLQGKHGMRLQQNLPAMTPAQAQLPMKQDAADKPLECNTCHKAHEYKLDTASVEACLSCHNDEHSLAYKKSAHYDLWLKEKSGELPEGSGVSCATCHMPRMSMDVSEWLSRTVVQHNQNATLVPNEKMIRPACMSCHGLGFSIDSLADEALIKNNFQGKPRLHIKSIDMAVEDNERHLNDTGGRSK